MTRKDYIKIAKVIREHTRGADKEDGYEGSIAHYILVESLSDIFKNDNDKFDADRFKKACREET